MRPIAVTDETLWQLKEMAKWSNSTVNEVLHSAIDAHYRKEFVAACNRAYERLKADPVAWQEELEERALWEKTIGDGLEDA